jgi:hypothetical protein
VGVAGHCRHDGINNQQPYVSDFARRGNQGRHISRGVKRTSAVRVRAVVNNMDATEICAHCREPWNQRVGRIIFAGQQQHIAGIPKCRAVRPVTATRDGRCQQ